MELDHGQLDQKVLDPELSHEVVLFATNWHLVLGVASFFAKDAGQENWWFDVSLESGNKSLQDFAIKKSLHSFIA